MLAFINVIDAKYETLQRYIVDDGSGASRPTGDHKKVIQPWPQTEDPDRQMEPVSRGFLRWLMKEMSTIIGRLAHRIDGYPLIRHHLYRFVDSMDHQLFCGRYYQQMFSGKRHWLYDINLKIPCRAIRIVGKSDSAHSFRIIPSHELRWNVTIKHLHTTPICDLNYVAIDGSVPFCGSVGGLITSSSSPMIDIHMSYDDVYDPDDRSYIARDIQLMVWITAHNPVNSHQQLLQDGLQTTGPFHELIQLTEGRTNFLFYYKTAPYNTGCAEIQTFCANREDEYFVSLTRSAPDFRYIPEAIEAEGWIRCNENTTDGFNITVCVDIGDFTLQIRASFIQQHTALAAVEFFQTPINCTAQNIVCDMGEDSELTYEMDYHIYGHPQYRFVPQAYITRRFYLADTIDKNLVLMVALYPSLYIPHRECGAGGLYILTEHTGWDLGPFCGGYATNHLATYNYLIADLTYMARTNITLGKEVTIIMKAYFSDFGMDMTLMLYFGECRGIVNPLFPSEHFNMSHYKTTAADIDNVIQWEPGSCLDITFMDSDVSPHPSTMVPIVSTKPHVIPLQALVHMNNPLRSGKYVNNIDQPNRPHVEAFYPDHSKRLPVYKLKCVNVISNDAVLVHYKSNFFNKYLGESLRIVIADFLSVQGDDVCALVDANSDPASFSASKEPWNRLVITRPSVGKYEFPEEFSSHNIFRDNCCTVQLKFRFHNKCNKGTDFLLVDTSRTILVKRPGNESQYKLGDDWLNNYHYKLGIIKSVYTVFNSTVLILPDRQNIKWVIHTETEGCLMLLDYIYRPHKWIVNGPPPNPVFNKTGACIADKCYQFSLVQNVTWQRASELCAETGAYLPVFNPRDVLQQLLMSSMQYRHIHSDRSSVKELREWKIELEDIKLFLDNFAHTSMAMLGSPFIYLGLSKKQQVNLHILSHIYIICCFCIKQL